MTKFIPQRKNVNQHTLHGTRLLEKSVLRDGFIDAQTAAADGEIISGSARLELSAEKFAEVEPIIIHSDGKRPIIVVRDDIPNADDPRAKRLSIAANQIGATDWNPDGELLKGWGNEDAQIKAMFADSEWQEITGEEKPTIDAEPQIDRAAELLEKWKVKTGDLWQIGEHRLICGDCTDAEVIQKLMQGEKAKYGFQDPPYGIEVVGTAATDGGSKPFGSIRFDGVVKSNTYAPIVGDDKPFDPTYILTLADYHVLWGANYYADKLTPQKGWIVWDKKGRDDWRDTFSDCELAWTNIKTVTRIFRHVWLGMVQEGEREKRIHPTQKPAKLYEKIMIDLFKEDGIVLDCFSGSAPTMVACQNLNRRCRAIEISPTYCSVALERMAQAFPGIEIRKLE